MAISPSMRRTAQVGLETTEGTSPSPRAGIRLGSFGLVPSQNMGVGTIRPAGQTATTASWISTQDSAWSVDGGVLSYDEVNYILGSAFHAQAPVVTGSGATLVATRSYALDQFSSQAYKSYTLESGVIGGDNRGSYSTGCSANAFSFEVEAGGETASVGGSFLGRKLNTGTMTTSPTPAQIDFKPAIPAHCKLYYGTTWSAITTPISSAFRVSFELSDRRTLYRFLGQNDGSPKGTVETVPGINFDLTLADEATPIDDVFMARAELGQKIYFRVHFSSANLPTPAYITGTTPYEFEIKLVATLRDGVGLDDVQEVQARSFPYAAAFDPNAGGVGVGKICDIKTVSQLDATALP